MKKDNWVFHNRDGEQLKPGLRKVLGRITEKLGFPDVTQVHALRHTYATHLIKCCKDIAVAQAQLGHTEGASLLLRPLRHPDDHEIR